VQFESNTTYIYPGSRPVLVNLQNFNGTQNQVKYS
jgi:hypothetical protein